MKKILLPLLLVLSFILPSTLPAQAEQVHISAAASMRDAVKALVAEFAKNNGNDVLLPNFGSSGALAKQVAQGAPADIFISANPKWMEYLVAEGRIAGNTVRFFAGNSLVLVGRKGEALNSLADLGAMTRIAIGSPKSVPAGQYAEQALVKAGLYAKLLAKNKLVMAKDVRQALLYAERGEVDAAFVYRTDAFLAQKAAILYAVPADLHAPIAYPVALTVAGEKKQAARRFYEYLGGARAVEILHQYGFSTNTAMTH